MKFRAHETFFIRKGWLTKGLKHISETPEIFLSKDIKPSEVIGIGTNMVKALRYWLQATGLTEEVREDGKLIQKRTKLGDLIWEHDRYLEEEETLWLIHYKLATNKDLSTTWYWFFNEFDVTQFDKEEFVNAIDGYVKYNAEGYRVAKSSLSDDYSCLVNTYVSRRSGKKGTFSPENTIESPLSVLGLIEASDEKNKVLRKITLKNPRIHPNILLAVIIDQNAEKKEVKISSLVNDVCNIGKIFNMDINLINMYLDNLKRKGHIEVIRTAGLDVVRIKEDRTALALIEDFYKELNQEGLLIHHE